MINYPSRGKYSFLGLDAEPEEADVIIFPVPYDSTTSYKPGTRVGPRAIILASNEIETFDLELKKDLSDLKICTLPELEPDVDSPKATVELVAKVVGQIIKLEKFPVMLGGEHTITIGAVKAASKHFENLTVLSLDAHADLRDSFQNSMYSHACTMRRCLEYCKKPVWVGVRSMSEEEHKLCKKKRFQIYQKIDVNKIVNECKENVYLTIDLDVLDPSIMPGVGTPVPCGLSVQEVLALLKQLFRKKNVVAADLVELIPFGISEDIAAALLAKLVAYKFLLPSA